ncbi:winged helix-turn-helix transcriptional regulator [Candidatus Pacearchaeota archaeon]|nr:winged helix-turn-helix transcriptional regulator [Candidatus Pacearchaeota archaeon]
MVLNFVSNMQKGFSFPIKVISSMLNGVNVGEIKEKELESQVLFFIKRNEKVQISDIADYFKMHPSKIISTLERLEKEDKIKRIN